MVWAGCVVNSCGGWARTNLAACGVAGFWFYSGALKGIFLPPMLVGRLVGGGLCILWRSSRGCILPHEGSEGINKEQLERSLR